MRFAPNRLWWPLAAGLLLAAAALLWPQLSSDPLEGQARRSVSLALALQRLSPADVDSYFGPPDLTAAPGTSAAVRADVQALASELRTDQRAAPLPRRARLLARVQQLDALLGLIAAPRSLDFDTEGSSVFGIANAGAIPPARAQMHARARQQLAALLPGSGSLAARVAAYRQRFLIPPDRRKAVFLRALAECRARTLAHWPLPAGEAIDVTWSSAVPAAWHVYLGQFRSRLQINPAAVVDPAAAIDVACHEAYPGHHAQFVVLEAQAGGMPLEEQIVLLRSAASALREGAANYGISLAFSAADRTSFIAGTLLPLAGLETGDARRYAEVHQLMGQLATAVVPILRRYRTGELPRAAALAALADEALVSSPDALLRFFEAYSALVLGYSLAEERVRAHIDGQPDRWAALAVLLAVVDQSALQSPAA